MIPEIEKRPGVNLLDGFAMCLELFLVDYEERIHKNRFDFRRINKEIKDMATPIRELPQYIVENGNLLHDILVSADILKEITCSSGVDLFLVNSRTEEIFKYSSMCSADVYKIGPGTVMAAYVAGRKVPTVSNDNSRCSEFPFGVSSQAITSDAAMCLPIITSKNNVVGVIQLLKDCGNYFTIAHLEMGMNMCNWIGSAIEQFYEKEDIGRENDLYAYFIHLMNKSTCDGEPYLITLPEMLTLTSFTLNAETCNYYTYTMFTALEDLGDKVLMFSPGDDEKFERRIEIDLGSSTVANEVIKENIIVNTTGAVISTNYISVIYKPREVTSILAGPIFVCGKTRGVIELINKYDTSSFTERDILILQNVTAFYEFIISKHVLEKQVLNLDNLLAYRHDTMIYHLKPCVKNLKLLGSLTSDRTSQRPMSTRLDLPVICLDIDNMFLSVIKRWRRIEEGKRHSFLLMIMKASLLSPLVDMRKVWSSVQFVTSVLRAYSNHFTETEKEVMLFSSLCYDVNNPSRATEEIERPFDLKAFPDPDTDFKSGFIPCDSFYLVKTIFLKSQIFHFAELKQLMEQMNIYMQLCHALRTFDTKEKLLKLLINDQFKPKSAKHRYLMRACIMVVAGQAIYLKPALFTANVLMNSLIATRGCSSKRGSLEYGLFSHVTSKEEFTKAVLMHLKLNILPWVILLRAILPRLKLYLKRCIEAIDDWKKIKLKDLWHYWSPDTSKVENDAIKTVASYLQGIGNGIKKSSIRKDHVLKIHRKKLCDARDIEYRRDKGFQIKRSGMKQRKQKKRMRKIKKWRKLWKRCSADRDHVEKDLINQKSKRLQKAYSKRKELESIIEKRKACLLEERSYDDQQKVILYSKKSKNKISNKLMKALAKNPEKVKCTLKRLIGQRKK